MLWQISQSISARCFLILSVHIALIGFTSVTLAMDLQADGK